MNQADSQHSRAVPERIRIRLAFFHLTVAGKWRRLTKLKRTPRTWTAYIPNQPEQEARHAVAVPRAFGRPRLPR
jgi:hypothetical protein